MFTKFIINAKIQEYVGLVIGADFWFWVLGRNWQSLGTAELGARSAPTRGRRPSWGRVQGGYDPLLAGGPGNPRKFFENCYVKYCTLMNNFWINNKRAIGESLKTTPDAIPDCLPRPMHFKWNLVLSNSQSMAQKFVHYTR